MNRTDRLYALVEVLRAVAPRPVSARRLAERFEVSVRTVERDLAALQQSGVPIWAEPGRTGGYCLDPAHTLAPLALTADEALAVTLGLGLLGSGPFQQAARSAARKVLAVVGDRRLRETLDIAARVHLLEQDPPPATVPGFAEALRTRQVLRLRYRDGRGVATVRDVEPLGCVVRDGCWYLVAWCRTRDGIRAFRGDRVTAVEPTGTTAPPRAFDPGDLDIPSGRLRPAYAP